MWAAGKAIHPKVDTPLAVLVKGKKLFVNLRVLHVSLWLREEEVTEVVHCDAKGKDPEEQPGKEVDIVVDYFFLENIN